MVRKALGVCAVMATVLVTLPAIASAGQWMQISCQNPDGSASANAGWSSSTYPTSGVNGEALAQCAPASPMFEYLAPGADTTAFSDESLDYTPPAGSTLIGGSVTIDGYAGGYGSGAAIGAYVYSPLTSDAPVFACAEGVAADPCDATGDSFSNTVTLPSNQGGGVHLQLACTGASPSVCDQGANADGNAGELNLHSAQLLLSNSSVPTVSKLAGTITTKNVGGHTRFTFTAADPDGPGVYQVNASIDGTTLFTGTPNPLNGSCVPVGTDPGSGALEFDGSQPCPSTVNMNLPVNTHALPDGSHEITVTVTDAAGNTTTVHDTVSTRNPLRTPRPKPAPRAVNMWFVLSARWGASSTRLLSITTSKLAKRATLSVIDAGPDHPTLALTRVPAARAATLLKELTQVSFSAGDRIILTVSAPHERSERTELTIRAGQIPTAALL